MRLVIEVDREIHNQQKEYDAERDKILTAKELTILRFNNRQVIENIELVLNGIWKVASERSQQQNKTNNIAKIS